jgi:UDP-3-O-[3-hydroxymyristoyl] glucosamine N-acyltransferase
MSRIVSDLARLAGGEPLGDGEREIDGLRPIEEAGPRQLSPLLRWRLLEGARTLPGAVLATPRLAGAALDAGVGSAIAHPEPVLGLARLIDELYPEAAQPGATHPSAAVDPSARVHPTAWVGPGVVIEAEVEVGEGAWIGPNAVICAGCQIGRYVRIGPGAVIGYEGFGFVPAPDGPVKLRQVGRVVLEDFVEIGACACVDRATLGETVIGQGTKLDNLVQIGHNARLGKRVLIAGQAGLAGSTVVGDDAMIGGQAGVADHLRVGSRAKIAAKSGVASDVPPDAVFGGLPAGPHRKWLRAMARLMSASGRSKKREPER